MTAPVRLQLRRTKGFDLQALSRATNRLPAISVARPAFWGNPIRVSPGVDQRHAVRAFRRLMKAPQSQVVGMASDAIKGLHVLVWRQKVRQRLPELRGKNLACFCKPGTPCHADILLELANA